jgi:hypothetical protein
VGDLTKEATWQAILRHVEQSQSDVGLITVDINTDGDGVVLRKLLSRNLLFCNGNVVLIYKLFVSSCLALENNLLDLLNCYFNDVKLSFPNAQAYGTKEVYAICRAPKPEPIKHFFTSQVVLNRIQRVCRALNPGLEGARIQRLLVANQFRGVPRQITPDPLDLLMSVFGRFQMVPSVQNTVKGILDSVPRGSVTLYLDLVEAICISSFIPFHRCYDRNWPGLSDNDIIQVSSLKLAIQLYLCARKRDYDTINQITKLPANRMTFSFSIHGLPGVLTYRFKDHSSLSSQKTILRSRDLASESFYVRALHFALKDRDHREDQKMTPQLMKILNSRLSRLNYAWTVDHIFNHTGLLPRYNTRSTLCTNCRVQRYMRIKTAE